MTLPVATMAPSPTVTGATSTTSDPIEVPTQIVVRCFATPLQLQVIGPAPILRVVGDRRAAGGARNVPRGSSASNGASDENHSAGDARRAAIKTTMLRAIITVLSPTALTNGPAWPAVVPGGAPRSLGPQAR